MLLLDGLVVDMSRMLAFVRPFVTFRLTMFGDNKARGVLKHF